MVNPNKSEISFTYESDVPDKEKIVVQKFTVDGVEIKLNLHEFSNGEQDSPELFFAFSQEFY